MNIKRYIMLEYVLVLGAGLILMMGLGYLCYDSWLGGLCGIPAAGWCVHMYHRWKQNREFQKMRLEFKDLLYALAAGLRAGYAMENAWLSAEKDIAMLYPEEDFFRDQIHRVGLQLELNVPIETAIREMAENCKLEEIYSFAEVLNTAKRSGGNLVSMMDKTSTILAEKIEVEQEIQTMLSGKKMEQRIMCGMPFFLLLYLRLTNAEYIEGLYHNIAGIIVVTICIAGTIVAAVMGERILGIEV